MDGGGPRKRKRLGLIVESPVILGQSSQYRLAEYDDQEECSKKVWVTAQESSAPNKDVLGVRQQLNAAHIGSAALLDTTTEVSKAGCKNGSGTITAEQVCFGMVSIFNSCWPFASGCYVLCPHC